MTQAAQPRADSAPLVFLIAGEPSGDSLGGKLMAALKRAGDGRVRFAGIGGERMTAEGLDSLFAIDDLAVMGLAEVLPRLPRLIRRLNETVAAIAAERPAAVVTIDAPSFCFRVARRIRPLGIPVIHYVAPQLWAWRAERARKLARDIDHMMVILPFEPEFFAGFALPTTYVGHPVIEDAGVAGDGDGFRARHGIAREAPLIAVLPGSRLGEVGRLAPVFGAAVTALRRRFPDLHAIVPVVSTTEQPIRAAVRGWGAPAIVVRGRQEKFDGFAAATAAFTSSGTATLELAIAGVPMIVAYRLNPITAILARRLITVRHVALPNLVLGRGFLPELLQDECNAERLEREMGRLLAEPALRAAQKEGLAEVASRLRVSPGTPSDRAARVVLDAIAAAAHKSA